MCTRRPSSLTEIKKVEAGLAILWCSNNLSMEGSELYLFFFVNPISDHILSIQIPPIFLQTTLCYLQTH
jgi:hypothetical protein